MAENLKQSVVSGVKWLAFSKLLIQLFRWGSTFWVIRMLDSHDYGVMAIAEILGALLVSINFLCIGNTIIRFRAISTSLLNTLFLMCCVIAVTLFLFQYSMADWFSQFYKTPEAADVLKLIAIAYLLECFSVQPMALLAKKMEFKQLAKIDMTAGIAMPVSVLVCAYAGMGYWSLAVGHIVNALVKALMSNYLHPIKYGFSTRFKRVLPMLKFGMQNTGASIMAQINNSIDFIVGGQVFSTSQIGSYQVGLQVSYIPLRKISPELRRIAFPAFSKVNKEKEKVVAYYFKSSKLISVLVFPLFWGLGLMAERIVEVVLTSKWSSAAAVIQVICFALPFKLLTEKTGAMVNALGRADILLVNTTFATVSFLLMLPFTLELGIAGLAYAWLVSIMLTYFLLVYRVCRILPMNMLQVASNYRVAILASIMMGIAVHLFGLYVMEHNVLNMLIQIALGALAYGVTIFILSRSILAEFKQLIKG